MRIENSFHSNIAKSYRQVSHDEAKHFQQLPLTLMIYIQGLDNETETLANVGGFTSICLAANLQSEARVDQ